MTVELPVPVPPNIGLLPRDHRGYPIPWFVEPSLDPPDFRVMRHPSHALKYELCWVCGQPRGRFCAFVIGPMCAINRISAEPPSHRACAEWSAKACPFLSNPERRRGGAHLPEGTTSSEFHLDRNPGVTLVWITRTFVPFIAPDRKILIQLGDPEETLWFARGREATHDEIMESIESGMPALEAAAQKDGPGAVAALLIQYDAALSLLPGAAA